MTLLSKISPTQQNNTYSRNQINKPTKKINKKAIIASTVGTLIPLAAIMKKQKTFNPFKLEYKFKDMIFLSTSPIAAGTLGGMFRENPDTKIKKIKEGTYQMLNTLLPMILVSSGLQLCNKSTFLNNKPSKIITVLSGIILGMLTAIKSANIIFDPKDIHPDRKITSKDCIANIDDAIGALALTKFPIIEKLHFDKFLPIIYTYCGYRAGKYES